MSEELSELKIEIAAIRESLQEVKIEAVRTQGKVEAIKTSVVELERDINNISSSRVAKVEFLPVQRITYGIVGVVLIAFLTAVISLVIPQVGKSSISTIRHPAEVSGNATQALQPTRGSVHASKQQ